MVKKFSSQDGAGGEEEGRVEKEMNSGKSVRWSAVPVPLSKCMLDVEVRGAVAPKEPITYAELGFEH